MTIGCDISSWQKGLDLVKVKEQGYSFAILRGGYTGTGAARSKNKDVCFDVFYDQAKAVGLPIGVYWFSCARTKTEGAAEADFLYENCLKGRAFEYPVYIDVESEEWQGHDKAGATDAIVGFCDRLESRGFFAGVYASASWFRDKLDTPRLAKYSKWVASWTAEKPAGDFDMWQNSSTGRVGRYAVDTNVAFKDFPAIIKAAGLNGFKAVQPEDDEISEISRLTLEVDRLKSEIEKQDKTISAAAALIQQALTLLEG